MSPASIRPWGRKNVPVLTGGESSAADRRAIEVIGVPQAVLMENAGRAAAHVVQEWFPAGPVVGLVGSGNNGGDGVVALRTLAAWGREVVVVPTSEGGVARELLHGWSVPVRDAASPAEVAELAGRAGVVIDGILGTGIRGAPRERQAGWIRWINEGADAPVVALDVPSGVSADTGAAPGEAVRAAVTVCFGWPKVGVLLHPGRAHAGRVLAVEIGFPPDVAAGAGAALVTPAWVTEHAPRRALDTHKNAVGAVTVVGGGPGMAGAAILAARAALRAGAGMVRVATAAENRVALHESLPEAVVVDAGDSSALHDAIEAASALVVGPGLGRDPRAVETLESVLSGPSRPTVLDADGLTLLAEGRPRPLAAVAAERPWVLTPHPGEMERLSGVPVPDQRADRLGTARGFAQSHGVTLLLKGAPSVVAAPGEPVLIDSVGSSDLATGGMGDVLAGAVGAFLAQGARGPVAAALGLHTSGRAAVRARTGGGLIPSDVVEALADAILESGSGETELRLPGLILDLDPAR